MSGEDLMAFAITYRHVTRPIGAATTIVGNEKQITATIDPWNARATK